MSKYLLRGLIFLAAFAIGLAAVFWFLVYPPLPDSTGVVWIVDRPSVSSLACLDNDQINVEFVSNAIILGVNVDSTNESCIHVEPSPRGVTLLMKMGYRGDIDLAELLLESGADINARDSYGQTALSNAVGDGNLTMARFLLEHGANVDLGGEQGEETPLMLAAWDGNVDMIECLLDRGANINARDVNGATPLMFAAGFNKPEAVRELMKRGANTKLKDKHGLTAAIYARHGFPDGYLFARE